MKFNFESFIKSRHTKIAGASLAIASVFLIGGIANHSHAESLQQPVLTTPHSESAASKNNAEIISTIANQKQAAESSAKAAQKASDDAKAQSEQAAQASAKAEQATATSTAASTSTSNAQSGATTNTQNATTQSVASTPAQSAPVDTSGFNFGGHHYPIAGFSGTGQVPATNYVYQWASDSRWFLIEQGGAAGQVIKSLVGMGTAITVNGRTYHVTDLVGGIPNNGTAYNYYQSHIGQHAIGFQTCDSVGVLTLYFAD